MTILFLDDWKDYPDAIIDTQTSNKSFLRISAMYREMGIKNHSFPLQLMNPALQGIDPYSEDLTHEQIFDIAVECKNNFFYFLRECVRVPGGSFDKPIQFKANRGNMALYWLFLNHITLILIQPRQTGKSFSTDVLMRYLLNIRCTNTQINLLTKDDILRSANLNRLKELEGEFPKFLKLRTRLDLANTEELTIKSLGNSYRGHVPNKSPKMAANVGRGLTSPVFHVDEAAFFFNIAITMPAALAAGTAARLLAEEKNEPYSNILTTTAGKKDDRDGKYVYNLLNMSAIWTEKLFDALGLDGLKKIIRTNSVRGELRVNCTFSHTQLGYSDEWLREALETSMVEGDAADRDFFNIWTAGTISSPLSVASAKKLRDSQVNDHYSDISPPYAYITRWFIPEDEVKRYLTTNQSVLSLDTSDAAGGDDISLILRDIKTGQVIAAGNYNETNLITFAEWILKWLVDYPTITLIIERRSTGAMIIDYLLLMLVEKGINPFKRIYNKIVQESEEFPDRYKEVSKAMYGNTLRELIVKYKKSFGFATSATGATSRSDLYSTTFLLAVKLTGDTVKDPMTIDQLLGLVIKNGRVDHTDGSHDDMCISWLLSFWLLSKGINLNHYGINPSDILVENKTNKEASTPKDVYNQAHQRQIRKQVEDMVKQIQNEKDDYITNLLEMKLRNLVTKLSTEDQDIVSVDDLLIKMRKHKKSYR